VTTELVAADLSRHLAWMAEGHQYFLAKLAQLSDDELSAPSALPGWTGRHLLSHVGHNARAIGRLVHWAASGQPTPMYPDSGARAAEIGLGACWHPQRLRSFVEAEHDALAATLAQLDDKHLATTVVTAQGRHVPAAILPWLRTREVWIHAVDLHRDADFPDFPAALLDELMADVLRWRRDVRAETVRVRPSDRELRAALDEPTYPEQVEGRTADLVRWLTGRGAANIQTLNLAALPTLSAWL
jgi:maleylpyruvate isomerase